MNTTTTAEELLQRAATLRQLAQLLAYPEPGVRREWQRGLKRLKRPGAPLRRLRRALTQRDEFALASEYIRLFAGNAACHPNETAYGDARRIAGRSHELADINGYYSAFGVQASPVAPQLPDHIASEIEFLAVLLVKEAYALTRRRRAQATLTRHAARSFLAQHLGRWSATFAASLRETSTEPAYRALASAIEQSVAGECRRLRVRPSPLRELAAVDPDLAGDALDCPRTD